MTQPNKVGRPLRFPAQKPPTPERTYVGPRWFPWDFDAWPGKLGYKVIRKIGNTQDLEGVIAYELALANRHVQCEVYTSCLDQTCADDWKGFTCNGCPLAKGHLVPFDPAGLRERWRIIEAKLVEVRERLRVLRP